MDRYLDASMIIALMMKEASTGDAETLIGNHKSALIISDFVCAEFASAITRMVRTKELNKAEALLLFSKFDDWKQTPAKQINVEPEDVAAAKAFLRRLDMTLRAPDALHIAMAKRTGAALVTFNIKMAISAKTLGLDLVTA